MPSTRSGTLLMWSRAASLSDPSCRLESVQPGDSTADTESTAMSGILVLPTTLEGIVAKTAVQFLGVDPRKIDDVINGALEEVGLFAGVDRSYVFQREGAEMMANTHEWCADGINPMIDHLQAVPVDFYPWFWEQIRERRIVHAADVSDLPTDADRDRENLEGQGVKSVVAVPMISTEGHLIGFIGFDAVAQRKEWSDHDLALLRSVSDMFVHALEHQEAEKRMEELVRSKDQFVASVSHELRTPLTVVLGLAAEMFSNIDHFDMAELREFAGLITEQSTEVARIVEDLLVVARADIGQVSISTQPMDLIEALDAVLRPLPPRLADRIERIDEALPSIQGDPLRVRQILRNLVSNALRYGQHRVRFSVETDDSSARLSVHDDGPGVAEDQQEAVFSPYHRGDRHETTPASIGIGLTVARTLARMMGGDVTCVPGPSGTFEVQLPRA